jgi:hypothetical protein
MRIGRFIEPLDRRTMLAASAPYLGTFTGTDTYTFDGQQQTSPETVVVSQADAKHIRIVTTIAEQYLVPAGAATIQSSVSPLAKEKTTAAAQTSESFNSTCLNPTGHLSSSSTGAPVAQSKGSGVTAQSVTVYQTTLPAALGNGSFLLQDNELSLFGTFSTGIFGATTYFFDGTKTTTQATASALSFDPDQKNQLFSTKPIVGKYKGHLTRTPGSVVMNSTATISVNSKGHDVIDLVFTDPGICDIEITGGIHPTHTGAFSLALGANATDGTLIGHLTHTGRLVLNLSVPGTSDSVGSQKKHGGG